VFQFSATALAATQLFARQHAGVFERSLHNVPGSAKIARIAPRNGARPEKCLPKFFERTRSALILCAFGFRDVDHSFASRSARLLI
jgi:hypothetical protein